MTPAARRKRMAYFAWAAVCVIWGTTYLGIRISLESMPPALMGGIRWLIAGSLLTAYLVARRRPLPPVSQWGGIALLGFLMLGLGNGGVVLRRAVRAERARGGDCRDRAVLDDCGRGVPAGRRTAAAIDSSLGLVIGFSGIVILVWPDLTLGTARQPGISRRNRRAADRLDRMVDWFVVFEASWPQGCRKRTAHRRP